MADEMTRVGIDILKIHHLHIVRGTALEREHQRNPFRLLTYEEYRDLLSDSSSTSIRTSSSSVCWVKRLQLLVVTCWVIFGPADA